MDEGIDSCRIGVKGKMKENLFSHRKFFEEMVDCDEAPMQRRVRKNGEGSYTTSRAVSPESEMRFRMVRWRMMQPWLAE